MPSFMLGKEPAIYDSRTLTLSKYRQSQQPPKWKTYGQAIQSWPMYKNNEYGDCTCAAAGHMIQCWTASAGRLITPESSEVMALYRSCIPPNSKPDTGCALLPVLKQWRSKGLGGHRIDAFVAIDLKNRQEVADAINLFGGCYLGFALPDSIINDPLNLPWNVPQEGAVGQAEPNINNGHCVAAIAYSPLTLTVVTWGTTKSMTWEFFDAYADEAFAILSPDFFKGATPQGRLDLDTLRAEVAETSKTPRTAATIRQSEEFRDGPTSLKVEALSR